MRSSSARTQTQDIWYRRSWDSSFFGNSSQTQSLWSQPVNLFSIHGCFWSPQLLPILPGPSQPCLHPLSNNVPLQLSNSTNDGENGTTQWTGSVDILLVADKINPQVLELFQGQDQMLCGSSEPVESPHQHHIKPSLLGIVHQLIESGSTVLCPTDTLIDILLEDVPTPLWDIPSQIQKLTVCGLICGLRQF